MQEIMKPRKLLRNILFSNQKSGVSGVLGDFEPLVLLQKVKSFCEGVLYSVNLQAVNLHLY